MKMTVNGNRITLEINPDNGSEYYMIPSSQYER